MIKCIHFIPVDGVGGVECAARSCIADENTVEDVDVRVMHLSACVSIQKNSVRGNDRVLAFQVNSLDNRRARINDPMAHLWAFRMLIRHKPDVLVCSLWRSLFVGILYKLFFPGVKLVCFLHSATTVRIVDSCLHAVGMRMADAIWADSHTTLLARIPKPLQKRKPLRTISCILENVHPKKLPVNAPIFVFWGRLEYMKGIDRALRFFAVIHQTRPDASFSLYGPDEGAAKNFRTLAETLHIADCVHFMGVKTFTDIQAVASNYSYYLLLSRKEGMAMSVVEAMQTGLVPIVTPVGEIARYCQNDVNALIVDDIDEAVSRVLAVLEDPKKYAELQQNAVQRWSAPVLYKDDFVQAVKEIA